MGSIIQLASSPLVIREIRVFLRSKKAYVALFLFLTGLLAIVYQNWTGFTMQMLPDGDRAGASRDFFMAIAEGHLLFVILVTPLLMAPSLAGEQEQSTLTLLLSSPISNAHLVFAKWLAPILYLILLLTASIPFLSVPFIGGGLSALEVAFTYLILLAAALMFGSMGLFCSTLRPRVYEVYLISVLATAALALLVPFHGSVWHFIKTLDWEMQGARNLGLQLLSPFYAFRAELQPTPDIGHFTIQGSGFTLSVSLPMVVFLFLSLSVTAGFLWLTARRLQSIIYGPERVAPGREEDEAAEAAGVRDEDDDLIDEDMLDKDPGLYLERRVQWFARWPVLFRLTYISLMISALTLPLASYKGSGLFLSLPFIAAAFFTLPLAATSISSDRERGTLDILLTTLLSSKQLVKAKFTANVLYSLMIALALYVPGMIIQMIFGLVLQFNVDLILQPSDLPGYLMYLVVLALSLMMYTALGLYFSALFARTNMAMLAAGVAIFATLVAPFLMPARALEALSSYFGFFAVFAVLFLSPLSGVSLLFPEGRVTLLDQTITGLRSFEGGTWIFVAFQCVICIGLTIYFLNKTRFALESRN